MGQRRQEFVLQAIRLPEASLRPFMRQIGDHDRDRSTPSMCKAIDDSCAGFEAPAAVELDLRSTRFELRTRFSVASSAALMNPEGPAGNALGRARHELRESLVAVKDRPIRGERQGALPHLFDHEPIRLVGTAEQSVPLPERARPAPRRPSRIAEEVFGFRRRRRSASFAPHGSIAVV